MFALILGDIRPLHRSTVGPGNHTMDMNFHLYGFGDAQCQKGLSHLECLYKSTHLHIVDSLLWMPDELLF